MFRVPSDYAQSMLRVCSEYVQSMIRVCLEYVQGMFRLSSEYIQSIFRVYFISSSRASSVSVLGIFFLKKMSLRGALQVFRKILGCCPNQGGGTSQSQLIVKVYQNIICLSTVHKFDETHTTYIGRGGNNISSLN